MLHILDNDIYDILEFIAANNTSEQIKEAEAVLPDKDEIQEQSFSLLKQFAERRV